MPSGQGLKYCPPIHQLPHAGNISIPYHLRNR